MRRLLLVMVVAGCGGADSGHPQAVAQKAPNDVLILGTYERRPPVATTAIRFERDGNLELAHDKSKLDSETLAKGTWSLEKDQLTINYTDGECTQDGPGVYQITVSKLGVHFKMVNDACENRAHSMDDQVWRRAE